MISLSKTFFRFSQKCNSLSFLEKMGALLILSWVYALCAQVSIKLPFMIVPIILHPLPLFIAVGLLGRSAVYAYALYYIQGAFGAPFFANGGSGMLRVLGPTGGYLVGMFFAMAFIAALRERMHLNYYASCMVLLFANVILYACGLFHLSFFVPSSQLLSAGLYPFIGGCTCKMIFSLPFIVSRAGSKEESNS